MDEKRLWMEAALTVPETLLLVGTSEGVLASIADACKLLGEDIWGSVVDDGDDEPPSTTAGDSVSNKDGDDFRVLLPSTCGLEHTVCTPEFTAVDAEQNYRFAIPFHPATASGGDRGFVSEGFSSESDEIDIALADERFLGSESDIVRVGERYIGPEGFSSESDEIDIGPEGFSSEGVEIAYDKRVHGMLIGNAGIDYWAKANLIASALAPDGPLAAAHREITRLIALHGEAGHVLALCAAPLGLLLRRDDDQDRAAFLPNAHAALRSLGSAASAIAAAEDFLRSWSASSSARCSGSWSAVTRLVGDARRDVLEARRAVERMQDAAVRDFFHAWMVIKRAPS
jgi:hypothetical protein